MFFLKKDHVKKPLKKVDKLATGLILGGIVASVYGIKKYEEVKRKKIIQKEGEGKKKDKFRLMKALFGFAINKVKK
ncbi:MAG: hypothetical protein PHO80_06010 [Candidatus Gracilibacteria bacterium]|nr:hypothetical protein [Candidatus Gracilibacteria bacterium]